MKKLNKKGLKQTGGEYVEQQRIAEQQVAEQQQAEQQAAQQQQQQDPVTQLAMSFSEMIEEGNNPKDVIMQFIEYEVPEELIYNTLLKVGYEEEDIQALFTQISNEAQQASNEQQAMLQPQQQQIAKTGGDLSKAQLGFRGSVNMNTGYNAPDSRYLPMDLYNQGNVLGALGDFYNTVAPHFQGPYSSNLFGNKVDPRTGFKRGLFKQMGKKKTARKLNKHLKYTLDDYNIKEDPNDPNKGNYVYDLKDLYDLHKGEGKKGKRLSTKEQYANRLKKHSQASWDPKTKRYYGYASAHPMNLDAYGPAHQEKLKKFWKQSRTFDEFETQTDPQTQAAIEEFQKNAPPGWSFKIDEDGRLHYVRPGADNPDEINTMMGRNTGWFGPEDSWDPNMGALPGFPSRGHFSRRKKHGGEHDLPKYQKAGSFTEEDLSSEEFDFWKGEIDTTRKEQDPTDLIKNLYNSEFFDEISREPSNKLSAYIDDIKKRNKTPRFQNISPSTIYNKEGDAFDINYAKEQIAEKQKNNFEEYIYNIYHPDRVDKLAYGGENDLPTAQTGITGMKRLGYTKNPDGTYAYSGSDPEIIKNVKLYNQGITGVNISNDEPFTTYKKYMEDNPGTRVDTVYTNNNQVGTYNLTSPGSYMEGSGNNRTFLSGTSPITSGQTVSDFWQNALNRPYGERKHGGENHIPKYQMGQETGWEETPDFETWKHGKMNPEHSSYRDMSNHDLYEAYKEEYPDKNFMSPQVTKKKKNFFDSPGMDWFGNISEGLVAGAGVLNEMALNKKKSEAENYLRTMSMADNAFGYYEDKPGTRGYWDANTGILQPDQQTPHIVQKGFETYQCGGSKKKKSFKNFIKEYQSGGEFYDSYIPIDMYGNQNAFNTFAAPRYQHGGQMSNEVEVSDEMIQKLIAAGADIEYL